MSSKYTKEYLDEYEQKKLLEYKNNNGIKIEKKMFEKYDKTIKKYNEDELRNIKQLNLIITLCESVERDVEIDKEIKFNTDHKFYFNENERILSNPSNKEKEDI